jgi:tetratricopeptide (TPR) repeat protein
MRLDRSFARDVLFLIILLAAHATPAPAAELKQIRGRVISIAAATFEFEYQTAGKTSRRTIAYDKQTVGRELLLPEASVIVHYDPASKRVTQVESADPAAASTSSASASADKPRPQVEVPRTDSNPQRAKTPSSNQDRETLDRNVGSKRATPAELLERRAQSCRHAKDALLMYRAFLADPAQSDEDLRIARARLNDWQIRSEEDLYRLGKNWVPAKDAAEAETQAHLLVKQALELTRLGDYKSAKQKLDEASSRDPNGIAADGVHGMLHLLISESPAKAQPYFRECLERHPQNISILNNFALCEFRAGRYKSALRYWENALALAPTTPELIQNIGRLIAVSAQGNVELPAPQLTRLSERYTTLVASKKTGGADPTLGWVYMYPSADGAPVQRAERAQLVAQASGSGFVVAPGYILTNRHVIEDAEKVLIHAAGRVEWEPLTAEVVAISQTRDLALVRCPELQAPAVPLADANPKRASEVMALGFPFEDIIGTGLKTTVGRVTGIPEEASDYMLLLDVLINAGNSGGPLCDRQGRLVGVITAKISDDIRLADNYALAVSIEDVQKFLHEKTPNFQSAPPAANLTDWEAVDQAVAPSTVRILTESVLAEVTLAGKRSVLLDRTCIRCNGSGKARCPNTACRKGYVTKMRSNFTLDNNGRPVTEHYRGKARCESCDGNGYLNCEGCAGTGIDSTTRD